MVLDKKATKEPARKTTPVSQTNTVDDSLAMTLTTGPTVYTTENSTRVTVQPTRKSTTTPTIKLPLIPLPTYPPDQAHKIVVNLYENPHCKLPCWWGITPGETKLQDAWQLLGPIARHSVPRDGLLDEDLRHPGYLEFRIHLTFPTEWSNLSIRVREYDLMIMNFDTNTNYVENYEISKIMEVYGLPQQIYVSSLVSKDVLNGILVFLYYPHNGFFSGHFFELQWEDWEKSSVSVCSQTYSNIFIWPPEENLSFDDAKDLEDMDYWVNKKKYKPIRKVSDYEVGEFYEMMKQREEMPCIRLSPNLILEEN